MTEPDRWVKAETEVKEHDFKGLIGMHIKMCKSILSRRPGPPYLFVDLHGGPGMLEYQGRRFAGSPLIAVEALERSGMPYQTVHFEKDQRTAERLWKVLEPYGHSTVIPGSFETGMAAWLAGNGHQPYRHGLIYSDPIGDPIPVGILIKAARHLPCVDQLAYVIANDQYKRANAGGARRGRIADDIAAVKKEKERVLVRTESAAHQFTFIVWSAWKDFPAWTARGFHPLESEAGQAILDRINLTKAELRVKFNTPLPLFGGGDDALSATSAW